VSTLRCRQQPRGDEATTGEQQDEAFHGGRPTDSPACYVVGTTRKS
jgi:hypothetical protein